MSQVSASASSAASLVRDTNIERALDAAYAAADVLKPFDIDHDKAIILSDQHRGARNGADDFLPAERSYQAALDSYDAQGHTLFILGDAEELWEESAPVIMRGYHAVLQSEARFAKAQRYIRLWGNHDDDWRYDRNVKKWLQPIYGDDLRIYTSVRLPITHHGKTLGELFLTHGHQGTGNSDKFAGLSRLVVRYFWRPLQRLTKYSFNTPSKDFSLREHHDQTMYSWAAQHKSLALIVGHTHRPVFKSLTQAAEIKAAVAELEEQLRNAGDHSELLRQIDIMRLKMRQLSQIDAPSETPQTRSRPCYFNTGCCCFPDGDITGIELNEGEIRLVRWTTHTDNDAAATTPTMRVLARATLRSVFAELQA